MQQQHTQQHPASTALAILMNAYPNQILIPAVDAGCWLGFAEKTVLNKVSNGTFPVPTRKISSKLLVDIRDLANFIDGDREIEPATPSVQPHRRKLGRPATRKGV